VSDLVPCLEHCVETPAVDIEADEPVSEEDGRDFASVGQAGQVCVVFELVFLGGRVVGASKQTMLGRQQTVFSVL
jgi:hypothetical protein